MHQKVLILGKLPPPYIGPAVATEILLNSKLKNEYLLNHLNTNIHRDLSTINKWAFNKVWRNISLYFILIMIILRFRPDLVLMPISQSTLGFVKDSFFIILSRIFRRKIIIHFRGSNIRNWLSEASFITRCYVSLILKMAQGVIVLGNNLKYLFLDFFPENMIFVVPNGADFGYEFSDRKNPLPKILYVSNLQESKGIEDVVNATFILQMKYKQKFNMDIIGSWRDRITKERCFEIIKRNNLSLTFHGAVFGKEKMDFFNKADIFVFPPREPEGHPWVIVEAMAAGLPIISTDQGAITESVIDGINGFIVEKKNPCQIADKVKYLLDNPDVRRKMGLESREFYNKNFTEEKMVERISKCFKIVLSEP